MDFTQRIKRLNTSRTEVKSSEHFTEGEARSATATLPAEEPQDKAQLKSEHVSVPQQPKQEQPAESPEPKPVEPEVVPVGLTGQDSPAERETEQKSSQMSLSVQMVSDIVSPADSKVKYATEMPDFVANKFVTTIFGDGEIDLDKVMIVTLREPPVTPLEPISVEDTTGRISELIDAFSNQIKSRIVPAEITQIPSWVNPQRHTSFMVNGKRYFLPKESSVKAIEAFKSQALETLGRGEIVRVETTRTVMYEGKPVMTFRFSTQEMKEIMGLFFNYGAQLVSAQDAGTQGPILVIGEYIHGR